MGIVVVSWLNDMPYCLNTLKKTMGKHSWLLIIAIVVIGLVMFLPNLTADLYGDEFATYRWSVLGEAVLTTGQQATLLEIELQLAKLGHDFVGEPWGIRIPGLMYALGTVLLVGLLARDLFGERAQYIAMLLAAFSPFMIEFSTEARPYAALSFWGTAFIISLYRFIRNEDLLTTGVLAVVSCFGVLTRLTFLGQLAFGGAYYLYKRRKITWYTTGIVVLVSPFIIRALMSFMAYESKAPKVMGAEDPVSTINYLLRALYSFSFGYYTFSVPDLPMTRDVPLDLLLKENIGLVLLSIIVALGLIYGLVLLLRINQKSTLLLLLYILVPSALIILVGQLGYTIVREKFLVAVLGAYLVLVAAIFGELFKTKYGKVVVIAYAILLVVSLTHYYWYPNEYGRRMLLTEMNDKILNEVSEQDLVVSYHIMRKQPNYLTFLDEKIRYVDISTDIPVKQGLVSVAGDIKNAAKGGRVFLIDNQAMKNIVDPKGVVLEFLQQNKKIKREKYGRNLSLYIIE